MENVSVLAHICAKTNKQIGFYQLLCEIIHNDLKGQKSMKISNQMFWNYKTFLNKEICNILVSLKTSNFNFFSYWIFTTRSSSIIYVSLSRGLQAVAVDIRMTFVSVLKILLVGGCGCKHHQKCPKELTRFMLRCD